MNINRQAMTDVPPFDEVHRELICCFDNLETAVAEGAWLRTRWAIERLRLVARDQFAIQEDRLRSVGYTHLAAHRAEHRLFAGKLFELMTTYLRRDLSLDKVQALRQWLADHYDRADRECLAYLPARPAPRRSAPVGSVAMLAMVAPAVC